MDITVSAVVGGGSWTLKDLLGRLVGSIIETRPGIFLVLPVRLGEGPLADIKSDTHHTFAAALKAVEKRVRGVCVRK